MGPRDNTPKHEHVCMCIHRRAHTQIHYESKFVSTEPLVLISFEVYHTGNSRFVSIKTDFTQISALSL